jgi:large subunit ribosomal protein L13
MSSSCYMPKPGEVKANWHLIDADGLILGRLAARVAMIVQGKTKPTYTPHVDTGDFVVIINAEKIKVTGRKAEALEYDTYSRYPGGRKLYTFKDLLARRPEKIIELAIRRMLPKNRIARDLLGKVKIFKGAEHPHKAQQPKELKLAM